MEHPNKFSPDRDAAKVQEEESFDGSAAFSRAEDLLRKQLRTHPKSTLLAAFAVGVFIGALLRD